MNEIANWRKGTASIGDSGCAEAGSAPGLIAVRDTKDLAGPVLRFTPAAWERFTRGVKKGAGG